MKFLCDRCKTRYSIGDDRVRGKILKIRCKNCANVITVREGMPEPVEAPAAAGGVARSRTKTTTAAPLVEAASAVASAPKAQANGALGAAFANAMSKPAPAALEEEWYVSIDGDQSGPFSLSEAQRWVASKAIDAELHCWSEGFDDWLPVDKVSHFRGLRKKPAPPPAAPSPPPLPRIGGTSPGRSITAAARIPDEEHMPKPLFAATMASLEKSAAVAVSPGGGAAAVGALRVEARAPIPAKPLNNGNGNGTGPKPALPSVRPVTPAKPLFEDPATVSEGQPLGGEKESRSNGAGPERAIDAPSAPVATKPMPHLKAVSPAAPAIPTTPSNKTGPNDAFLDALAKERNEKKAAAAAAAAKPQLSLAALAGPAPMPPGNDVFDPPAPPVVPDKVPDARSMDDDDMEIGEVSRVVNLADLRPPAAKRAPTVAPANRTGAVGRVTGPVGRVTGPFPKLNGTGAVALIDAVDSVPSGNPPALEPAAEPEQRHSKRGLYLLLAGAAVLLGTAAVILILKLNTTEDVTGLGGQYEYNTERPDLVVRRPGDPTPGSNEPTNPFIPPKPPVKPPPVKPPTQGSGKNPVDPPTPTGNSLKSDEVEAMARSTSSTTTACFRRASKGADDIILSDVKKIRVVFKVNPDGTVAPNSVDLSEKRSATLSACLQRMVAGWKFRPNPGGDFGFVLAKPD